MEVAVTIRDIARIANVSTATVSRVLNKKAGVGEKVSEKVQQAVDESGFKMQRLYRKPKQKPWLVVLTESSINSFHATVLSAIQEKALGCGYLTFVVQVPDNFDRQKEVLSQLKQGSWAGIISAGFYMDTEEWTALRDEMSIPIVLMNSPVDKSGMAYLKVDFERAVMKAIQSLIGMGHRQICFIGDASNEQSQAELRGVVAALDERGFTYPEEYRISAAHTLEGATQSISRIVMLPPERRPTAIIAFDDEVAIHLLNALRYFKLRVPEDISLIGFDNIPMSARTFPALTTIDVPKYRIGQNLVELMLQLLQQGLQAIIGHIIIDGSLIIRESTGPVNRAE